jgi:ABC-type nitrate/sulfonate/bicarbonate transport system substrate-binding protein
MEEKICPQGFGLGYSKVISLQRETNGEIHAFSMREPYVNRAKTLLRDNLVVFEESGLYPKTSNLVAFNTFIKDIPQAVKSVRQALIKSEEFVEKYPDHAQRIVEGIWILKN